MEATETFDVVIRGVNVFDGHAALPGLRDVGLRGSEIAAVSETTLRGAQEIDGAGGWLMPGLIDTHIHFFDFRAVTDPDSRDAFVRDTAPVLLRQFLESGITTIKSVGDPTTEILELRDRIAAGAVLGPRLLATGNGLTGRDGHPASTIFGGNPWFRARATGEVDSPEMMRDLIHHLAELKIDAIKVLSEGGCRCAGSTRYVWQNPIFPNAVELVRLSPRMLEVAVEIAHEQNLRITVHTVQQAAAIEALEAGADGLEHGVTVEPITDPRLVDLLLKRNATYASTLWIHDAVHPHTRSNTKLVSDAGVKMVLGSDSFCGRGAFGENSLEEAELMVAAGMTPQQVLIAGTSTAAWHLGRHDIGTVAVGQRADLIMLAQNPLASIGNLRTLSVAVLDGKIVVDRR